MSNNKGVFLSLIYVLAVACNSFKPSKTQTPKISFNSNWLQKRTKATWHNSQLTIRQSVSPSNHCANKPNFQNDFPSHTSNFWECLRNDSSTAETRGFYNDVWGLRQWKFASTPVRILRNARGKISFIREVPRAEKIICINYVECTWQHGGQEQQTNHWFLVRSERSDLIQMRIKIHRLFRC